MTNRKLVTSSRPSEIQAEQFDMLFPILDSVFNEIKELSKKNRMVH